MQTLTEETIVHAHYLHWSIWECSICHTVCSVVTSSEIRFDIFQMWTPHEGHVMEEGSGDNIVASTIVSSLVKVCNGNNYQCQLNAESDQ